MKQERLDADKAAAPLPKVSPRKSYTYFWMKPAWWRNDRRIQLASIIDMPAEDVAEGWSLCTKSGPQRIPLYILPDARHVPVKRTMLRKC